MQAVQAFGVKPGSENLSYHCARSVLQGAAALPRRFELCLWLMSQVVLMVSSQTEERRQKQIENVCVFFLRSDAAEHREQTGGQLFSSI